MKTGGNKRCFNEVFLSGSVLIGNSNKDQSTCHNHAVHHWLEQNESMSIVTTNFPSFTVFLDMIGCLFILRTEVGKRFWRRLKVV